MLNTAAPRLDTSNALKCGGLFLVSFCVWAVLASTFVISYHAQEQTIYYWDYDNYPRMFRTLVRTWETESPRAVLNQTLASLEYEYTFLPAFLLLPAGLFFGDDRTVFLTSVASIYGFVAVAMTLGLYGTLCRARGSNLTKTEWLVGAVSLVALPTFWFPILRGFPDVFGMGIISGILYGHLSKPLWERSKWQMLGLGLTIASLLWFRRWYAYFVVAMIVSIVFDYGSRMVRKSAWTERWQITESFFVKGFIALGVAACLLISLSPQQWLGNLLTPYRELYSSYRTDWGTVIYGLYEDFGLTTPVLLTLGLFFSVVHWGWRAAVFMIAYLVSGFLLFQRTQNLSPQHYYGLMPGVSVMIVTSTTGLLRLARTRSIKVVTGGLLVLLFSLQLASFTSRVIRQNLGFLSKAFPLAYGFPLRRSDLGEIRRLLNAVSANKGTAEEIYVVASSAMFSEQILMASSELWGYGEEITNHILRSHEVDSRDGFPWRFFDAKLVVVASPVQIHLPRTEQRNVTLLYEKIVNDVSFQSHFERFPYSFNLDRDVQVSIYRLKQPFEWHDIQSLLREYQSPTL